MKQLGEKNGWWTDITMNHTQLTFISLKSSTNTISYIASENLKKKKTLIDSSKRPYT